MGGMSIDLHSLTDVSFAEGFAEFIVSSPTSYHAAAQIAKRLSEAGFHRQIESERWSNAKTGFIIRDGAVVAWRLPSTLAGDTGFRIVGSHTDSPSFKVKPNPEAFVEGFSQVNVEVYGGPLLNSWLNRDLGIAGRVVTLDGEVHLVATPAIMTIPQLAPHLDRSVNDKLELSRQRDYHPMWAIGEASIFDYVCNLANISPEKAAAFDLYAYDVQKPSLFGGIDGKDFFASGRQDNLSSVYSSLLAFLAAQPSEDIQIFAAFDHEEVGSATYTGADGPILESVMRRICAAISDELAGSDDVASVENSIGVGDEAFERMLANSSCISADAGHSVNPNKAGHHDPNHHPVLGSGPLLKINANQRYATEATGAALWLRACYHAGASTQEFVSNNDVPCGSTIGPFTAARLGIVTVDVGVPLLSMHSVRELCAPRDLLDMAKILESYWSGV